MIIKRKKVEQLEQQRQSMAPDQMIYPSVTSATGADVGFWDANDFDMASPEIPEKRAIDRRRSYRRLEEKQVINEAYAEAERIREQARNEGYQAGLIDASASVAQLQEQLSQLLIGRAEVLESVADQIGPIAVEIAERIIKTEVSCDETLVMRIVLDTIQKVGRGTKSILVKVHPDDVLLVKSQLKEHPIENLQAEVMVSDDPGVDPGSCWVETNSGLIDASFKTRLAMLRQLFGSNATEDLPPAVKLVAQEPLDSSEPHFTSDSPLNIETPLGSDDYWQTETDDWLNMPESE
ncbi:MAG: hypothetical protein K2X01_06685 [Cyanobacteria bacterium]|nr:hypothetical protein [Cyanobacteriota bacterium]